MASLALVCWSSLVVSSWRRQLVCSLFAKMQRQKCCLLYKLKVVCSLLSMLSLLGSLRCLLPTYVHSKDQSTQCLGDAHMGAWVDKGECTFIYVSAYVYTMFLKILFKIKKGKNFCHGSKKHHMRPCFFLLQHWQYNQCFIAPPPFHNAVHIDFLKSQTSQNLMKFIEKIYINLKYR